LKAADGQVTPDESKKLLPGPAPDESVFEPLIEQGIHPAS